jgi:hypothetical protein
VLAGSWSSPDVVAQASEALGARGAIVHTVTVEQPLDAGGKPTRPAKIVFDRKPRRVGYAAIQYERWSTDNPRRERSRSTIEAADGGAPGIQEVTEAAGVLSWKASWLGDKVQVFHLPKRFKDRATKVNLVMPGPDPVAGVRSMLADHQLRNAGETTVGGRRVLSLRGEIPSTRLKGGHVTPTVRVEYLVDPDSFEPVRIDQRVFERRGGREVSTGGHRVTFKTYERLPLTPANLALLKLPR